MTETNSRLHHPTPRAELERRWALVRAEMKEAEVDALIVQAANNLTGTAGHFRWLTGISVASSYPQALIMPREGPFTLVMHGDFDGETDLEDANPSFPGIGRRLTTPNFPGVHYCGTYDGALVAGEIKRGGYQALGVLTPNTMHSSFTTVLREELGDPQFIDLTSRIDAHKAVKSAAEIDLIRRAAAMQDSILEEIRNHIEPGKRDFEIMAYGQYLGQLAGSDSGYFLGSSAPPGEATMIRRTAEHGRRLDEGDILYFQCENTGPGGIFTHAGRYYVLGKAPQQLQDAFGVAVEAQDFTIGMLQPGASCREIFAAYNAYMEARGFAPERRVHCHGQGYDNVEPPLIRQDETMTLTENMNLGLHPLVSGPDLFVTCCDNVLIGANGSVERLHRTPREIVELT